MTSVDNTVADFFLPVMVFFGIGHGTMAAKMGSETG
jgi:hypothetical protein